MNNSNHTQDPNNLETERRFAARPVRRRPIRSYYQEGISRVIDFPLSDSALKAIDKHPEHGSHAVVQQMLKKFADKGIRPTYKNLADYATAPGRKDKHSHMLAEVIEKAAEEQYSGLQAISAKARDFLDDLRVELLFETGHKPGHGR